MPTLLNPMLRSWPIWALLTSAAMLAIAHAFQTFGGLAPCTLCLQQRDVYWVAMAVAALAVAATWTPARERLSPLFVLLLVGVFAAGAAIAARHAGAEWKWWPAPVTCSSTGPVNLAQLKALLAGTKTTPGPACDQAPWVFLGLSMAGWNCLISAALVGLSLTAAARKEPAPHTEPAQ